MKIIVKITDGKRTYSEDVTDDYHEDKEQYKRPVPEHDLLTDWLNRFNTRDDNAHFIFGWCECFFQSDDVPNWMYGPEECLKISVLHKR